MKKRLKTLKVIKEEFKPLSDYWSENGYDRYIIYNDMVWTINSSMRPFFGTEIEVKKFFYDDYTHIDIKYGFHWHELWFEPEFIEFLSVDEVNI